MDEPLKQAVTEAVQTVTEAVQKRKFTRIQYVSEIHEYLTVTALIKKLEEKGGHLTLELATGQEIRFDRLVKVGDVAASHFNSRDFTCDC